MPRHAGTALLAVVMALVVSGCAEPHVDDSVAQNDDCALVEYGAGATNCPAYPRAAALQQQADDIVTKAESLARRAAGAQSVVVTQALLNRAGRLVLGDPPPENFVIAIQGSGSAAGLTVSNQQDPYICTVVIGPDPDTDVLQVLVPAVCSKANQN